jgi:hypothetical protein
MATLSLSTSPTQEFPWETLEQDLPLSQDRLGSLPAPIFMAHPCCPSNHTQICSQACGGCGRGVCDDGACECLCC